MTGVAVGAGSNMANWAQLFESMRPKVYERRQPLILINGLAEQTESWFRNRRYWARHFEVHVPNVLVYDGPLLQDKITRKDPISVDYLVEQFHQYVTRYVQTGPVVGTNIFRLLETFP